MDNYTAIKAVLEYADHKYTHVVFNQREDCEEEFWCLVESEQEAIDTVKASDEDYEGNDDYKFTYGEIHRSTDVLMGGKISESVFYRMVG